MCPGLQLTAWRCGSSTNTIGLEYWGCASQVLIIEFSQTAKLSHLLGSYNQGTCSQQLLRLYHCNGRKACEAPSSTTTKVPVTTPDKQAGNKSLVVKLQRLVYTTQGFLDITVSRQLALFPFGLAAQSSSIHLHSTLFSVQPRQGVYSQLL